MKKDSKRWTVPIEVHGNKITVQPCQVFEIHPLSECLHEHPDLSKYKWNQMPPSFWPFVTELALVPLCSFEAAPTKVATHPGKDEENVEPRRDQEDSKPRHELEEVVRHGNKLKHASTWNNISSATADHCLRDASAEQGPLR